MPGAQRTEPERGQASVELLGALPAVLLALLIAWQLALAGHAGWLAGNAARAGARATAVGADAEDAARSALPQSMRRGLRVTSGDDSVVVRLRIPIVLPGWRSPLRIGASAGVPGR